MTRRQKVFFLTGIALVVASLPVIGRPVMGVLELLAVSPLLVYVSWLAGGIGLVLMFLGRTKKAASG